MLTMNPARNARCLSGAILFVCYGYAAYSSAAPLAVGTTAPDFKSRNLVTHEKVELAQARGKLAIVTFWATWCGPCRRELPLLERAQQLVGKDRLAVFAVNYRDTPEAADHVRSIAKDWQLTFVEDRGGIIAGRYKISSIPHLFMINRDGEIIADHVGYGDRSVQELVDDINHALGAPAAQPAPDSAPPPAAP
jgi:thiol-disulfide isomerase/thioredoxin